MMLIGFISNYHDQERLRYLLLLSDDNVYSANQLNNDLNSYIYKVVLFKYIKKSIKYKNMEINRRKQIYTNREIIFLNGLNTERNEEYIALIPESNENNTILDNLFNDLDEVISDENLNRVVKKLTNKQRIVIQKIILDEIPEKEVAQELGITIQGVNKLKNVALQNIRHLLEVV